MGKYVFIMNSTKPSLHEYESLDDIKLNNFSIPCIEAAHALGYEIIVGINRKHAQDLHCIEYPYVKFYNSNTYRSIFNIKDIYIAYKNLCSVLNQEDIEVIHCNTPIGGVIGRVCGHKFKISKIIYTAHGFHFFKGAPFFYNTILKRVEYFLAKWTDILITINEEDYQAAKKMKLKKNGKVYKVNGVGINLEEYQNVDVDYISKRKELGIGDDDFVCIAMGDLVKRKNYRTAIEAIAKCNNPKIVYLICGAGPEMNILKKLARKLKVDNQIHFLGFRNDIKELLAISDCFLFTSLQEGLPRSTMEAMASGLPCIVSEIRGNVDLITHNKNGFTIKNNSHLEITNSLKDLFDNHDKCNIFSIENIRQIKKYDNKVVKRQIIDIYHDILKS